MCRAISATSIVCCARSMSLAGGKSLLCFYAPAACHSDLLLRLANTTREQRIAWWRSAA